MIPLGIFLWTAVIKPLVDWFRGKVGKDKAVKDKDGPKDGDKAPDTKPKAQDDKESVR